MTRWLLPTLAMRRTMGRVENGQSYNILGSVPVVTTVRSLIILLSYKRIALFAILYADS